MTAAIGLYVGAVVDEKQQQQCIWLLRKIPHATNWSVPALYGVSLSSDCNIVSCLKAVSKENDEGSCIEVLETTLQTTKRFILTFSADNKKITGKEIVTQSRVILTLDQDALVKMFCGCAVGSSSLDEPVPPNPIEWVVMMDPKKPSSILVGAGYFVSGDVPGHEILTYSLERVASFDDFQQSFVKRYEVHPETDGISVLYSGSLRFHNNRWELRGSWQLEKYGTCGTFYCNENAWPSHTPAVTFCSMSSLWKDVGTLMIFPLLADGSLDDLHGSCFDAAFSSRAMDNISAIQNCAQQRDSAIPMVFESVYFPTPVSAETPADVVRQSFVTFHSKVFLLFLEDFLLRELTYGEVWKYCAPHCHQIDSIRRSCDRQVCVVLSIPTNSLDFYFVSLAVIASDAVVVPIPPEFARLRSDLVLFIEELKFSYEVIGIARKQELEIFDTTEIRCWESELPPEEFDSTQLLEAQHASSAVAALLFTSGSSSASQAVIFSQELVLPTEGSANIAPFVTFDFQPYDPTLILSVLQTMLYGSQRLISRKLNEVDICLQVGQPTHVGAPPSFWTQLKTRIIVESVKHPQTVLGSRIQVATTGGAPIAQETLDFFNNTMKLTLTSIYASRETGGIARNGTVFPGVDVRVIVDEEVCDFGSGEIVVSSPRMANSYWKGTPSQRRKNFEYAGKRFFRTGDVGVVAKDGDSTIVDVQGRLSGMAKLPNGTWRSSESIEAVIEAIPQVFHCILLVGVPYASAIGCVIVPTEVCQRLQAAELGQAIRARCATAGAPFSLTPTHLFLELPENRWSQSNGLLTSNMKKKRIALRHKYQEATFLAIVPEFDGNPGSYRVHERVVPFLPPGATITSTAGCSYFSENFQYLVDAPLSTTEIDSLALARICSSLPPPLREHIAQSSMMSIGQLSEILFAGGLASPTAHAAGLSNDIFFFARELENCVPHPISYICEVLSPCQRECVLVSGPTGFLGPVIVKCIASNPLITEVVLLTRRRSLDETMVRSLEKEANTKRSKPVVCRVVTNVDLCQPFFGVQTEFSSSQACKVSCFIHNAAAVSYGLPYGALKAANVISTVNIAVWCAAYDIPLVFVSSSGALPPGRHSSRNLVSLSASQIAAKFSGYGQSKAIAEAQLIALSEKNPKFCCAIVRPGAISPHTADPTCRNPKDAVGFLLRSCAQCNTFPKVVNCLLATIPVDFVSLVVNKIVSGLVQGDFGMGIHAFNVVGSGPNLGDVVEEWTCAHPEVKRVSNEQMKEALASVIEVHHPLYSFCLGFNWQALGSGIPCLETTEELMGLSCSRWPTTPLRHFFD